MATTKKRKTPVSAFRTDPAIRSDGKCTVCRRERSDVARINLDPFCSNACCRNYYHLGTVGAPTTT